MTSQWFPLGREANTVQKKERILWRQTAVFGGISKLYKPFFSRFFPCRWL